MPHVTPKSAVLDIPLIQHIKSIIKIWQNSDIMSLRYKPVQMIFEFTGVAGHHDVIIVGDNMER